jgi:hypothetical protein
MMDTIRSYLNLAKRDYLDVLYQAEFPLQVKIGYEKDKWKNEEIIKKNIEPYEQWLKK